MSSRQKKTPTSSRGDQKLRIIGGQWRGRVLPFPDIEGLRPTGSRIRETLFNWLMPVLPNSNCLDLYSGSGALGFEALSRGAKHCYFFEQNPSAYKQLLENCQTLKTDSNQVHRGNTLELLSRKPEAPFDIVFLDPPFDANLWQQTVQRLEDNQWLKTNTYIYIETPVNHIEPLPSSWHLLKHKKAGQVKYCLYIKSDTDI